MNQLSAINTTSSIKFMNINKHDQKITKDYNPLLETISPINVNIKKIYGILRNAGIVLIV